MSAYSRVTKLTNNNQNMVGIDNTVSQSLNSIIHNRACERRLSGGFAAQRSSLFFVRPALRSAPLIRFLPAPLRFPLRSHMLCSYVHDIHNHR